MRLILIEDYESILCQNGTWEMDTNCQKMDKTDLGCVPSQELFSTWKIAGRC